MTSERIADLVEAVEKASTVDEVRELARDLVQEVIAFHGEGLRLFIDTVREKAPEAVTDAVRQHPLVASLFELHGVVDRHPPSGQLVPVQSLLKKTGASKPAQTSEQKCEFCGTVMASQHPHVVAINTPGLRSIQCACRACALLFEGDKSSKWRRVPEDVVRVPSLANDDVWWGRLGLPVGVAFFVRRGEDGDVIARYPGPVGVTESRISKATWEAAMDCHPRVAAISPEVQALLVNRTGTSREHWIVGVDRCFSLVTRLRERWRGLTGGDEVRSELTRFVSELASV
jgi:hypothetical protein